MSLVSPSPIYTRQKTKNLNKMAQIPNKGSEDSLICIRIRLDKKLLLSNRGFCKIIEKANFQMLTSPPSVLLPESSAKRFGAFLMYLPQAAFNGPILP